MDATAPEYEIGSSLEHCCRQLLKLKRNLKTLEELPTDDELDAAKKKLFDDKRDYTCCWIKLESGQPCWSAIKPAEMTNELMDRARDRYSGSIEEMPKIDLHTPLQKHCGMIFQMALTVLRTDGYAAPFAFILNANDTIHQCAMVMEDRAEKHMVIRQVAEEARRCSAKSVAIVNEAWMAPATGPITHAANRKDRTEGLIVQGVDRDGEAFSIIQPFRESKRRSFFILSLTPTRPFTASWFQFTKLLHGRRHKQRYAMTEFEHAARYLLGVTRPVCFDNETEEWEYSTHGSA